MTLFEHIKSVLSQNESFCKDGQLFKNKVVEAGLKLDSKLLKLLLNDDKAKRNFFTEIDDIAVFDKDKFQKFISNKQFLPDSYTAYKNKIGLTANGEYLTEANEIVLDFPYKDCVLIGGQSKEEQSAKEVFINKTLAADDIDLLLENKVITNCSFYKNGLEIQNQKISLENNFIIKGNNLVAISSISQVYKGAIKLIYIDPPYNTGSDGFNYNDSFTHSAWLTFIKNRLEIAYNLLRDDGIIFISCDDRENAYLKVLMDNIFGRENFITNLIWRKKAGGGNDSQDIAVEHEYILAYRKKMNGIYKMPLDNKTVATYKYKDSKFEIHGPYKTKNLNDPSLRDSPGLHYDIRCPDGTILKGDENQWKCNSQTFKERLNEDRIVFKQVKGVWKVYYKIYLNEEKGKLKRDKYGNILPKGRNLSSILYQLALNKDGSSDIKKHFKGKKPFSYPKPVNLIKTLIQVATGPNDIILDFFAGSGTTGEAVLSINKETNSNRKFILIEQMDYVKSITLQRLLSSQKLYNCSKTICYFEFKEINKSYIDKIKSLNSATLQSFIEEFKSLAFVDYRFNSVIDKINLDDDIELIKSALIDLLDFNLLYLNYSEMMDKTYNISESDINYTNSFYNLKI